MVLNEALHQSLGHLTGQSQESAASHPKLIAKFQKLFRESNFDEFFQAFTLVLQNTLVVATKNPNLDRVMDFITKFSTSLSKSQQADTTIVAADEHKKSSDNNQTLQNGDNDDENTTIVSVSNQTANRTQQSTILEDDNIFLTTLLDYLIEISRANSDIVRFRCCQILSKLMVAISNDQCLDEDLYDRLSDSLLERLKDINSRVQSQAISAIYRLQDPNDRDCRISTAFLFLMQYDPNWMVRFQALSHIAYSKQTLPDIIDRVRDPHPAVRRKALMILSEKVLIKFISIEKRLFILNYALKDDDASVVETCCKKLLPSWLVFKENEICKLLKALDVVEATETMGLMLEKMFENHSSQQLYEDVVHILTEKHVISYENLNAESVFYWSWACSKFKSTENDKNNKFFESDQCANNDESDYLDKLVPSLTEYCEYVQYVFKKMEEQNLDQSNQDTRKEIENENEFIIKQLIKIFVYIDFSDPHGKKTLQKLCHDLFSNRNYVFIFDEVMKIYRLVVPSIQQRINNIVELISDIQDPHALSTEAMDLDSARQSTCSHQTTQDGTDEMNLNPGVEKDILDSSLVDSNSSTLSPREIALRISELKFNKLNLKEEFDTLYKAFKSDSNVDINMLSELRNKIAACEKEITTLQNQLNGNVAASGAANKANKKSITESPTTPSVANNQSKTITPTNAQHVQDKSKEEEVDPILCHEHCLHLTICLLQDVEIKTLTPHIRSLYDNLVLDNIGSVDERNRMLAVRALNLMGILKIDIAQKYFPLLLEIILHDKKMVVIEAFKALINFIMAYTLNRLVNSEDDLGELQQTSRKSMNQTSNTEVSTKILSIMTSLLDSDDSETYTMAVEGFCKLFMTGHIISAKLFSKLLIMYYNPMTESDTQLRAILSSFLPQFSFIRSSNQLCVEESFMLTIKCLIGAQPGSFLAEIDLIKVAELLFNLSNPRNLIQKKVHNQRQIQTNNICHENIFRSICYEILKDDNAFKHKTYLKLLQMADLSDADYMSLKSINQLAEDIHDHIDDKMMIKTVKKLCENILTLIKKKPEYVQDQKEKENNTNSMAEENQTRMGPNESESQDSEAAPDKSTRSYNSGDLIDPQFQKLQKKTLTKEQLLKKALNNTVVNKTTNLGNESMRPSQNDVTTTSTEKQSIFKKKETVKVSKVSKKRIESTSNTNSSEEEVTSKKKSSSNSKSKKSKKAQSSDDEEESDQSDANNTKISVRRTSARLSSSAKPASNSEKTRTSSGSNIVCIKELKIPLIRVDISEPAKSSRLPETEPVNSKGDDSLRVQLLRSRSDKSKSTGIANESTCNRSKSLTINDDASSKATSSKRSIPKDGKSMSRRAQSAEISHDQSNINTEDEPPAKKGRATKKTNAPAIRTRSSSNRGKI